MKKKMQQGIFLWYVKTQVPKYFYKAKRTCVFLAHATASNGKIATCYKYSNPEGQPGNA